MNRRPLSLTLQGQTLRLHSALEAEELGRCVALVEGVFRDMEVEARLEWGHPPQGLDTSSRLLVGALNLAHRVVVLEREAARSTQDLEKRLALLLDAAPEDDSGGGLFGSPPNA